MKVKLTYSMKFYTFIVMEGKHKVLNSTGRSHNRYLGVCRYQTHTENGSLYKLVTEALRNKQINQLDEIFE